MKFLFAIALALGIAATAYAAAATLLVTGGTVQATVVDDLSCDTDGINIVGYGVEQNSPDGPTGHNFQVNGIDAECDNKQLGVSFYRSDGSQIGSSLAGVISGGSVSIPIPGGVLLEEIEKIHVLIAD